MSSAGAAPRAAVPISNARAVASRKNGAKSRGPRTAEGKARAAQNAVKHGMRAQKYVVLPDEDAVEFAALQTALFEELAPEGALQLVLARRVAIAAWRLARADRLEIEVFEQRRWNGAGVGVALIRDGNGTRSFETLLRYRAPRWPSSCVPCARSRRSRPSRRRSCPYPHRRPCACSRADPQRAPSLPKSSNRTNPRAAPSSEPSTASNTSGPTHPGPALCCTRSRRRGCRTNPRPKVVLAWTHRISRRQRPYRAGGHGRRHARARFARHRTKQTQAPWVERTRGPDERAHATLLRRTPPPSVSITLFSSLTQA
jgi:hypothetical protein